MSSSFATEVLETLLERSVTFSVVFLVAGALWLLIQRRQSSHVGSLWFCLPLVVLVLPLERWIPNPWTGANPIERATSSVLPAGVDRVFVDPVTEGSLDFSSWKARETGARDPRSPEAGAIGVGPKAAARSGAGVVDLLLATALGLWLLGVAVFLTRLVRGQRLVPRLLESATRLEAGALPVDLEGLREAAGVRCHLTVFESPEFESPAVWTRTTFRSGPPGRGAALILPEGLVARLSADELRWVLLHELAHVSRRDDLTELVQRVLGAVFFFHPLVWFTNRLARVYRELACDDAALARCRAVDRPSCARALYEVVAHATALAGQPGAPHRTPPAMASLFHSKSLLRKRIMRLTQLDRPLSLEGLRAGAVLPILLTSAAALSAARFPAVTVQDEVVEAEEVILDHDEVGPELENDPLSVALRAVEWLRLNQDEDGGWSYDPPAPDTEESAGAGWAADLRRSASAGSGAASYTPLHSNVALTGLAILALLEGSAHDPTDSGMRASVDRGTAYLLSIQDADQGVYGPMDNPSFMVGHALATEALAKAWAGDMNAERAESLRAAVNFLERARNPYGAWRYSSPPDGDNDARVTGYVLLALSAAYDAGVHASPESFAAGMRYLAELEDAETGRTFYMQDKPYAFRLAGRHESFPAERAEVPTAMHMRLRTIAGLAPTEAETLRLAKRVLAESAPLWDLENGTIDFNYWWQGTEALAAAEPRGAAWEQWSKDLLQALVETQITRGPLWGTWPTVDAWSGPGLEVYTTATNAMSLFAQVRAGQ